MKHVELNQRSMCKKMPVILVNFDMLESVGLYINLQTFSIFQSTHDHSLSSQNM